MSNTVIGSIVFNSVLDNPDLKKKVNNILEPDLWKVLAYEVQFLEEAQSELIEHAEIILRQAKNTQMRLNELKSTLGAVQNGKDWRGLTPETQEWMNKFLNIKNKKVNSNE